MYLSKASYVTNRVPKIEETTSDKLYISAFVTGNFRVIFFLELCAQIKIYEKYFTRFIKISILLNIVVKNVYFITIMNYIQDEKSHICGCFMLYKSYIFTNSILYKFDIRTWNYTVL